ncbi:MAG: hypothetical protein V3V19_04620 [Cocleimonas sp.]
MGFLEKLTQSIIREPMVKLPRLDLTEVEEELSDFLSGIESSEEQIEALAFAVKFIKEKQEEAVSGEKTWLYLSKKLVVYHKKLNELQAS